VLRPPSCRRATATGGGGRTHTPKRKRWSEDSILEALQENRGQVEADIARRIFAWAKQLGLTPNFGTGAQNGSYWPGLDDEAGPMYPFMLWTSGTIVIDFGDMVKQPYPPFDNAEKRRELQRRLNTISGVQIPDKKIDQWPNFPIAALAEEALDEFFGVMEWTFDETRQAHGDTPARPAVLE
jgi:hypothetical protein